MPFDGITSHLLASELNSLLAGTRIDKVFQPDKQTVIIHIRANARMEKLLISCNPASVRMNLTSTDRENPKMPPSFCMLLRKYLSGAKIESITCPSYERIIEIKVSNTDELRDRKTYTLICELMGRYSNLILVNQTGKIIDSMVHIDLSVNRYREIMPARIYEYPPAQDKLTPEEAYALCLEGKLPVKETELGRSAEKALLNSVKGLSPSLARRLTGKCGSDDRTPLKMLSDDTVDALKSDLNEFFSSIRSASYEPTVYYSDNDEPLEYMPFSFEGNKLEHFETISDAIDRFYESKDKAADLDRKKQRLTAIIDSALSHSVRKLQIHEQDLEDGSKAEYYKKCADLILSNTYRIEDHASQFTCDDYYEDPPKPITIELNPVIDASANAQDYYKRFHKAKRKLEMSEDYIKSDREAISYFRSLKTAISSASCEEDIMALEAEIMSLAGAAIRETVKKQKVQGGDPNRMVGMAKSGKHASRAMREAARRAAQKNRKVSAQKNEKALSYRKYMTSDGYEILSGRNNIQNDELTFKVASKDDWWFHVKGLPGTHVILKAHKGEEFPSDNAVLEAASLAVFFSKSIMLEEHSEGAGSRAGEIKAEVDYCPVSHVKKIPGARPGMVIYENYYSVLVPAKEPS